MLIVTCYLHDLLLIYVAVFMLSARVSTKHQVRSFTKIIYSNTVFDWVWELFWDCFSWDCFGMFVVVPPPSR